MTEYELLEDKITFVIPSINRPTLIDTIDSLLSQTNKDWECIVVYDDVDGISFEDTRIKTIKIEKKGILAEHNQSGLVRNEGIKLVKTKWIGFIDDDDTIDENYVDTLYKKYFNYDFVVWRMIYKNGVILPPHGYNNITFGKVGISFCYKNIFNNLYFDNNRDGEDWDFLIKLRNLTGNYVFTDEVYYYIGK